MKGFFKRLIIIDVTLQEVIVEPIKEDVLKKYMGGKGLGTRLLLDHNPPRVDPLSPDNSFIMGLGPATDSRLYGSCRYGIYTKSPLTGFYGESYSGGSVAIVIIHDNCIQTGVGGIGAQQGGIYIDGSVGCIADIYFVVGRVYEYSGAGGGLGPAIGGGQAGNKSCVI